MGDFLVVLLVALFFLLSFGMVAALDRLR